MIFFSQSESGQLVGKMIRFAGELPIRSGVVADLGDQLVEPSRPPARVTKEQIDCPFLVCGVMLPITAQSETFG